MDDKLYKRYIKSMVEFVERTCKAPSGTVGAPELLAMVEIAGIVGKMSQNDGNPYFIKGD